MKVTVDENHVYFRKSAYASDEKVEVSYVEVSDVFKFEDAYYANLTNVKDKRIKANVPVHWAGIKAPIEGAEKDCYVGVFNFNNIDDNPENDRPSRKLALTTYELVDQYGYYGKLGPFFQVSKEVLDDIVKVLPKEEES